MTYILDYFQAPLSVYAILWVLVIKGTFQCELEMNGVVDLKHSVKRVVKRLSRKVTEVKLKGAEL